jgi:hypothetical protein
MKIIKFPSREMGLGIAVIAVVAVALATSLGLFGPLASIVSKPIAIVKGWLGGMGSTAKAA